jgi:hypothetical protein
VLPRTQVEIRFPFGFRDQPGGSTSSGLAGIDVSALYNLNAETRIPALAIAGDVLLPVGSLAPDRAYPSLRGIATRTFPPIRFHLNGQYTFGEELATGSLPPTLELSRWLAGVAVDRTFPLQSFLLTAEVFAQQPLVEDEDVEWVTGAGTRFQVSPRIAADAGLGYRMTGNDQGWYVTFGAAYALGLPW